jgi:hypothetical protein
MSVTSGKTDTGDTVNPGGTLDVLSGGTISNTTDALQQREHIMTHLQRLRIGASSLFVCSMRCARTIPTNTLL